MCQIVAKQKRAYFSHLFLLLLCRVVPTTLKLPFYLKSKRKKENFSAKSMKQKFCLCYCPAVVETEDSADVFHSPNNIKTLSSSKKISRKETESYCLPKSSSNKGIHKLPSRKIFSYKNFPRLCKAILFQDPLVSQ